MNKIILDFDKHAFETALSRYEEKKAIIERLETIAKNDFGLIIEVTDSHSLKANVFKALEAKHEKQNPLNLTGEKLAELMGINFKPLFDSVATLAEFDQTDINAKPKKEAFTLTVDNEKELERFNHAVALIEMIHKTRALTANTLDLRHFYSVFRNVIRLNEWQTGFEPLPSFVKT